MVANGGLGRERRICRNTNLALTMEREKGDRLSDGSHTFPTHFVGRERELRVLRAAVTDAINGRGRVVLVSGEPGVGKTSLAQEIGRNAEAAGMEGLWGRGWEGGGAAAYWPWIQIMRGYSRSRTADELHRVLGPTAPDIAEVISIVRERLPELAGTPQLGSEEDRFRFFDSFSRFVQRAAAERPLFLVLDDLHCIDAASHLLLQFVARELEGARLVIVGTYRDEEVQRSQSLSHTLGELSRGSPSQQLTLAGLDSQEIAQLIALTAGQAPRETLVAAIARHTEGNPFFVREVTHLLAATGRLDAAAMNAPLGVPAAVHGATGRRLERLSSDCNAALSIASVIGREFSFELLARTAELEPERVIELMDEAIAARVVTPDDIAGSYRFGHSLIRETLYAQLPTVRRLRLHQQIGRVLETLYAAQLPDSVSSERFPSRGEFLWPRAGQVLSQLAYHCAEARALDDAGKAVKYGHQAAACAMADLAYEDAGVHCERTLEIVEATVPLDERVRCALLLTLSGAQTRTSDLRHVRATALRAVESARRVGDAELLARAALALPSIDGVVDEVGSGVLEEARQALGPGESALKARVLGRLGRALRWSSDGERGAALRLEAVEMARRGGDQRARADTLVDYGNLGSPDGLETQFAVATEILQLGEATGNTLLIGRGLEIRANLLLLIGDLARSAEDHEAYERLRFEPRRAVNWVAAMRALLEGRFDDTERLAQEALLTADRAGSHNAPLAYAMQVYQLQKDRGQLRELVEAAKTFASQYSGMPGWRCSIAAVYAEMGSEPEARALFSELAARGFADLPRDGGWLAGLSLLTEVCAFLHDADRAAVLYDLLHPYAGLNVVVAHNVLCLGAVAHYLGVLATTFGRWPDAERHFQHALQVNARLQARPAMARTQHESALMLLERAAPGDRSHALELLRRAIEVAEELGMKALLERALALEVKVTAHSSGEANPIDLAATTAPGERPGQQRLRARDDAPTIREREGDYWTLSHGGSTCRLKDIKGLQYLAHLLRHPGQEFHALDLMRRFSVGEQGWGEDGPPRATGSAKLAGLDATAKAAYKRRLIDLRAELEEAEQFNDPGRREPLRLEIDSLTEQLASAVGLGGRDRDAASATERARSTVTQRIKSAVKRIGERAPVLADYLSSRVKTGTYCVYQPDPAHPIVWQLG